MISNGILYGQSGDPFRGRPACELIALMEMYMYADWSVTALIPCRGRTSCALLKSSDAHSKCMVESCNTKCMVESADGLLPERNGSMGEAISIDQI